MKINKIIFVIDISENVERKTLFPYGMVVEKKQKKEKMSFFNLLR